MPYVRAWTVLSGFQTVGDEAVAATDAFAWIGASGGSWAKASNWRDVTAGASPAATAPGAADPVTIAGSSGPVYESIVGGGTSASLALTGYVALNGSYGTGGLTVGSVPVSGSTVVGGLTLGGASELTAGTVAVADGDISVSGTGASLAASGAVSIGSPYGVSTADEPSFNTSSAVPGTLSVAGGATLTAASGIAAGAGTLSVSGTGSAIGVIGDVTIGTQFPTDPVVPYTYFNTGSLSVLNGASLTATGSVIDDQGMIEVSGTGSVLRLGGTLIFDVSDLLADDLFVQEGATLQANGLLLQKLYEGTSYPNLQAPAIGVDSIDSALEIGSAGGAATGFLTIDAGQTLAATTTAFVYADIINKGAISASGGTLTLGGSVVNDGTIGDAGGTLTIVDTLSGPGVVDIPADASVVLDGPATAGGTLDFAGANASLIVNQTSVYNGQVWTYTLATIAATLSGFAIGDAIILPFNPVTSADWAATASDAGVLSLLNGTSTVARFDLSGNFTGDSFTITPTTTGGGAVTLVSGGGVTATTVAQALESYAANAGATSFAISDTALAVQNSIDALQAMAGAIETIALTDSGTPVLAISWMQIQNDAAVLALLPGDYQLVASGVLAADVSAVQANGHVTAFSIADSAADVVVNLTSLQALAGGSELGSISLTDSGMPVLTLGVAQLSAAAGVLSKIAGVYDVSATDTAAVPVQGLDLADVPGGDADVTVIGDQAVLTNSGGFTVGDSGVGSLAILSGATVMTNPGTGVAAGLVVGNAVGAAGSSVDVSGAGSRLTIGGMLLVGAADLSGLRIGGGATVTADALDAGLAASAVADIELSGAGTGLIIANGATVADAGTGVLSVLAGATFAAAGLTIGAQNGASGALVVSGADSRLRLAGALDIGTAAGTGDLTVGPGADIEATAVFQQGQVVLEGGLLDPTVQLINQGQTAGGFGTIAAGDIVDEGAIQAGGNKTSQRLLIVQGTVLGGGTLTVNGTPPGSVPAGIMQINAGGTLELTGAVLNAATTTFIDNLTPTGTYTVNDSVIDVNFVDGAGVLLLNDIAGFGGTIAAYQAGDSFVISGGTLSGLRVSNGDTLTVQDAGVGGIDRIVFGSAIAAEGFAIVNSDTIQVACFAAGTRIATPAGPIAVEALTVGDRVLAADTGEPEPIVWIGRREVACDRHPRPETVWPIRVRAGAFGEASPSRDLFLSPDHAVFVHGVLVPVKLLVDGAGIAQVRQPAVTYFHLELPRHAVILAEGLPVESYLDIADRDNFHAPWQQGASVRLFPDFAARLAPGNAWLWEAFGAAPLVMAGDALRRARRTVATAARCHSGAVAARVVADRSRPATRTST